jgi:hypothetical protein
MGDASEHSGARGVLYDCGELGPRWVWVDAIGLGGRCFWTASCAKSRGESCGVGGWLCRTVMGRVQSRCLPNGAWRGRVSALQRRARVALRLQVHAVQACMNSGAGRGAVARERRCTLCALWRLDRRRPGTVGAARTVGFGLVWPGELILGIQGVLVAR